MRRAGRGGRNCPPLYTGLLCPTRNLLSDIKAARNVSAVARPGRRAGWGLKRQRRRSGALRRLRASVVSRSARSTSSAMAIRAARAIAASDRIVDVLVIRQRVAQLARVGTFVEGRPGDRSPHACGQRCDESVSAGAQQSRMEGLIGQTPWLRLQTVPRPCPAVRSPWRASLRRCVASRQTRLLRAPPSDAARTGSRESHRRARTRISNPGRRDRAGAIPRAA